MRRVVFILLAAIVATGCSRHHTIDGTNANSFSNSLSEMTKDMKASQRTEFISDLKLINHEYGEPFSTLRNPGPEFLARINGKSYIQVHAKAKLLRHHRNIKIATRLRDKLSSLKHAIKKAELSYREEKNTLLKLQSVKIDKLKLGKVYSPKMMPLTEITFHVTNTLDKTIILRQAKLRVKFGTISRIYPILGCLSNDSGITNAESGIVKPNENKAFHCSIGGNLNRSTDPSVIITGGSYDGKSVNYHGLDTLGNMHIIVDPRADIKKIEKQYDLNKHKLITTCQHLVKVKSPACSTVGSY